LGEPEVVDLVVFDCDGVLVDSEPIANRVLTQALTELGLSLSAQEVSQATTGHSMKQVVAWAERALGGQLPQDFVSQIQALTYEAFREELKPVSGADVVLDEIAANEIAYCVASSGDHEKMRFTLGLTGLLGRLEGRMFSTSDVARGKPAPDVFLLAAREHGVAVSKSVVIEDSLPGVAGGLAAGMTVYGFAAHAVRRQNELREAGAIVFDDLRDLPELLGLF
jgi:HAD superfamily hydrolase (TIGR01509 family)